MSIYQLVQISQSIGGNEVLIDPNDKVLATVNTEVAPSLEELNKLTVQQLAAKQRKLSEQIDTLKNLSAHLQKQYDGIRLVVLPEKMDEEGITNITVDGVGRVSIQSDIYFSIPAPTKEEAYEWLKDNGHGDLIQETVNSSSGKAWAKEMIKKGLSLPEALFKVTPFSRSQITKK